MGVVLRLLSVALVVALVGCDAIDHERATPSPVDRDGDDEFVALAEERAAGEATARSAGDAPVVHSTAIQTSEGRFELDELLEHHVVADDAGPWIVALRREPGAAWTGTLHVGRPGALVEVADQVARGLRSCETRPQLWALTRTVADDPGARGLWILDGDALRERPLPGRALDRVAGVSPDCRHAIIVTRGGGLPVIELVALAGEDEPIPLANHDLSYTPGQRPAGFVTPPTHADALRWDDLRTARYDAAEGEITLTLPEEPR